MILCGRSLERANLHGSLVSAGIIDAVLQLGSLLLEVDGYYLEWLSHMSFIIQQTSLHLFVWLSQDSKVRVKACKSS